ncbi:hypothetical protein CEP54_001367 [Fusarium duplospermum]|uniref:Uncharacterized protein n=1 Tax=Fusarium duplospermum TaxID=1325734 RepID=A0A428R208_9HYPO|nr:hypothetical protein CEP54_001367 [Fusarium duplospermum]
MRLSKQTDANQSGKRPGDHHNSNAYHSGNWDVNKPANMHGHLARSLHTASDTGGSRGIEPQWTRARFTLEESHREWESKRQAFLNTMTRLRARLRASNEVEDGFVLVDADPLMVDSTAQISQPENTTVIKTKNSAENGTSLHVRADSSLATASPSTRRQLMARQRTHLSSSDKARIGVKKKSPIAVRFRKAKSIPLETQLRQPGNILNTSNGNTPAPGSIVTAGSQKSMASDFTFVDWFIVVMFVVQSVIWISVGYLFVSALGS